MIQKVLLYYVIMNKLHCGLDVVCPKDPPFRLSLVQHLSFDGEKISNYD